MGPVLRARVTRSSNRTGNKPADCVDDRCEVLADKTNSNNYMSLRRKRNVAIPQPNLSNQQKPCIFKLGNSADDRDLSPQERLALYNFEVDENEPLPQKLKCKRKVRHRKKIDLSDTSDEEYFPGVTMKKRLQSGGKETVARQRKLPSSHVSCHEKITLENKENISVADTNFKCQSTDMTHHDSDIRHNMAEGSKGNVSVAHTRSSSMTHCDSDIRHDMAEGSKGNVSVACTRSSSMTHRDSDIRHNMAEGSKGNLSVALTHSSSMTHSDSDIHTKTVTENTDSAYTCQKTSVTHNKPRNMMTGNKEVARMTPRHLSVHRESDICTSLAEGSELNLSVGESESSQVPSSCGRSLFFSPIEKCPLQPSTFVTIRRPGRGEDTHGIQSVQDFTVDNCFGFDEESDDDLHLSLSPVKIASHSKPVLSVPFAVCSTPNLKPTLTRPEATSSKLMQSGAQTRPSLISVPSATVCVTAPEHSVAPSVEPPDIADAARDPSPPSLFVDKNDPVQHFMKVSLAQGVVLFHS
jgi:hypothetical protein